MEWLALGPPQTEAPNYKVGSPPLSWQPLPFLSLSFFRQGYGEEEFPLRVSLSLSLSLLCSRVTAASSPSSPRGVRATPSNILYIYIYICVYLSLSLSFFLLGLGVTL